MHMNKFSMYEVELLTTKTMYVVQTICLILGKIDYYEAFLNLVQLHKDMESMDTIQSGSVYSWYYFYDMWLKNSGKIPAFVCR